MSDLIGRINNYLIINIKLHEKFWINMCVLLPVSIKACLSTKSKPKLGSKINTHPNIEVNNFNFWITHTINNFAKNKI